MATLQSAFTSNLAPLDNAFLPADTPRVDETIRDYRLEDDAEDGLRRSKFAKRGTREPIAYRGAPMDGSSGSSLPKWFLSNLTLVHSSM